jgi:hypothetical protein
MIYNSESNYYGDGANDRVYSLGYVKTTSIDTKKSLLVPMRSKGMSPSKPSVWRIITIKLVIPRI